MGYVDLSTLHTPIGGARPPASYGRQIEANFDFLAAPPSCRVYNSANLPTVSGTPLALTFNSERWDWPTTPLHSTAANTDRLTAPVSGKYRVGAAARFASNPTNQRELYVERFNSAGVSQGIYKHKIVPAVNGNVTDVDIHTEVDMSAGDYVKIWALQNSGAAINVLVGGRFSPEAWVSWFSF